MRTWRSRSMAKCGTHTRRLSQKPLRVQLESTFMPDQQALEFLQHVHDQIAFQGVKLEVRVKEEWRRGMRATMWLRWAGNNQDGGKRRAEMGAPLLPADQARILVRFASLVDVDVLEECLDVAAVLEVAFANTPLQRGRGFIVPAALAHEFIPDLDLLLTGLAALGEAPLQNLLIGAALLYPLDQCRIFHRQEVDASAIKTCSEIRLVIRRKLPRCMEPDLVEHSPEVDNAPDLCGRTAQVFNFHGCERYRSVELATSWSTCLFW